ncbi:hypothetical protein [Pseudonocardia acaciae]|uniref:hypothetical protein n=1 Tax=Pseudonocardia acaciae TaxID=551276 RepID=UPI00048D4A7D|nr:hypothetical protein [Pseudonocardia acaciae]
MTGLVVVAILAVVAALAPRYGVDSRDGRDWSSAGSRAGGPGARRTLGGDLRALGAWLARMWDAQERAWGACWRAHQPWRGDDPPASPEEELHWREEGDGWRLRGRMLPPVPPAGEPSARID